MRKKKMRVKRTEMGLKLDMDFDEAMRRISKIKPRKPAKRKK
jgi:hypothetical protein